MRGKDDHAQLHAVMEYSGHLIDQCEDILALWIYDELTKSQVVRCRTSRFGGVHVLIMGYPIIVQVNVKAVRVYG